MTSQTSNVPRQSRPAATGGGAARRLPEPVASAGRSAFRAYGMLTADWRPMPDYVLIGTKRGGTTSTHFHLLQHPMVLPLFPEARYLPKKQGKGPHFFDSNYERGSRWYRSHFPSTFRRRAAGAKADGLCLAGESSPYYLFHPLAAARMHGSLPDTKILIALRNPVDRTYSHYRERRRSGAEELSFEDALSAEEERTSGAERRLLADPSLKSYAHEQQSYAQQSEYVRSLERWLDLYPREAIHFWFSEEYYADPVGVMNRIVDFLGLPKFEFKDPGKLEATAKTRMSAATREALVQRFAPGVQDLQELLGVEVPWAEFQE